jgi:negative regulator of flagellin synthesis FlgM
MSIKIDLPGTTPLRPVAPKSSAGVAGSSGNQPVSASGPSDRVLLTGDALNRQQIDETLATVPKVDAGRVERLKAAVADGSYSPNPATIAAKLARLEWDLAAA